ncbi:hypothetical protein K435DRAFT_813945 [Dendrothele bispora CBS 962.96]|uniref:Myb/SANT-like domain-containing protein n=1 Tax=Dendrothele bispora (strain CBS 962.96) TaxID=1314807 RepID=A0A4S8KKA3_DENBC|nr:hypothetical protein K435DRAFT_813945 [Dendrothele bispora CBS 962.96]
MPDSEDKENQEPLLFLPTTPIVEKPKRGWPKGSKNKPRDPSAPSQQKKTPAKKHSASSNTQDITPAPKHAIYSNDDNKTLMEVFLDQKAEGRQTSNGNWKTPALTAAVKALAASEATSGGAPKTASSIRDHWKEVFYYTSILKAEYVIFKTLLSKSGWGWDSENQCVLASDEQWDTLIEAEPQFASYRGKSFPIYEEMDELLNGALATGSHAFHAGKVTSDESDSNSDSGNEADVNPDTSFEDISASQVTPGPAHTSLKCKVSALETPVSRKRSRHERTGRTSTSASIHDMSRAIESVATAIASDSKDSHVDITADAIAIIEQAEGFSKLEKAKLILKLGQENMFGTLLVNTTDVETRMELMQLQLA